MLWKAGGRPGGHRSEYHRQFGWKKPVPGASPLLTAEQVRYIVEMMLMIFGF